MERSTSAVVAESFMALFAGLTRAHGLYTINNTREDGKRVGAASTHVAPVTLELWERHIEGKQGLGIIPIRDGNDCLFGAIDIDVYNLDHRNLVAKLQRAKLPLVVCRTKSGGAHLYCFTHEPVAAKMMRAKLNEIASYLGYGGCEIFPKQEQILASQGDVGQWINMPYMGGTRGMRYAIDIEGHALSIDEFILEANASKVDTAWFSTLLIIGNEFVDGPPCLQVLAQSGYPAGTRNDGLYNIGVYLKRSDTDDWENQLDAHNHRYMDPPLTMAEVQGLIKSLKKKEYQYACNKQPIAQHCNSGLCRTRKFGVGSSSAGRFPVLGGLTKLDTKPCIWFWTVDGVRMELTTQELQDPRAFQRKCMEYLHMMPQLPSATVWQVAIQHAMDTVTVIEAPRDASPEGQFWEHVEKFCTGRAQARALEEIVLGKPFTEQGRTYFRMADLLAYLSRNKFFEFRSTKIASMLKDANAEHHFKNLKGRGVNYWSMVEFAKQTESFSVPDDVSQGGEAF